MDKGRVAEYDTPYELLVKEIGDYEITKENGVFAEMVKSTGQNMSRRIFEIAREKYLPNQCLNKIRKALMPSLC